MKDERKMITVKKSIDLDWLEEGMSLSDIIVEFQKMDALYPDAKLTQQGSWGSDDWFVEYTRLESKEEVDRRRTNEIKEAARLSLKREKKMKKLIAQLSELDEVDKNLVIEGSS